MGSVCEPWIFRRTILPVSFAFRNQPTDSGAPLMPPRSTSSYPQPLKHSSEIETPSVGAPLKNNIMMKDKATQIFTILKQSDCNYLVQADCKPVLQEVVETHPGLEFLKDNEYQDMYGE